MKDEETGEIEARLLVTAHEDGASRELPIGLPTVDGAELVIGRSRKADLVLQDPYLSGRHLSIVFEQGGHRVTDLASTHGSTHNDQPLTQPQRLKPGDRLTFGHCSAVYYFRQRKLASAQALLKPPPPPQPQPPAEEQPAAKPEPTAPTSGNAAAPAPASPSRVGTSSDSQQAAESPRPHSRSMLTLLLGLAVILVVLGVLVVLGLQVFLGIDLVSDFIGSEKPS